MTPRQGGGDPWRVLGTQEIDLDLLGLALYPQSLALFAPHTCVEWIDRALLGEELRVGDWRVVSLLFG